MVARLTVRKRLLNGAHAAADNRRGNLGATPFLSTWAGMVIVAATPAYAQTADTSALDAGAASISDNDEASSAASEPNVAEIVVTASRRAENLQRESRTLAVVTGSELVQRGVSDPAALAAITPGLTIARNGTQLQVSVRGVGDRTANATTDPAVSINLDNVPYPRSSMASASFFDLERVEVLKGPQGTLYGRNSSAGVINLISIRPRIGEVNGYAELEVGDYNHQRGVAAVNLPLGNAFALRVAGQVIDRSGYLSDGYNDEESEAIRAQLLAMPTETTSVLLTGAYSHLGGLGQESVIAQRFDGTLSPSPVPNPSYPWTGARDPATIARIAATNPSSVDPFVATPELGQDVKNYHFSALIEQEFDFANLTLIPSYVSTDLDSLVVVPGIGIRMAFESDQLAFEARLFSPEKARVQWVVGGFLSKEDVSDNQQSRIPFAAGSFISFSLAPERDTSTRAVFGEATAPLTDLLRLIAGARYTWEKKSVEGFVSNVFGIGPNDFPLNPGDPLYPASGTDVSGRLSNEAFNFRLGAEYDVAPSSMLYATVSTGFKAGGFFPGTSTDSTYEPEKLTAYTLGSKNRFLNDRVQLNVEAFYWDYKDKQETFLGNLTLGAVTRLVLFTRNAGKAHLYGLEANAVARLTANDTVSFQGEYVKSEYDSYVYSYIGTSDPTVSCGVAVSGPTVIRDCSGFPLVRAPEWSGRISYEHIQSLGSAGELTFNAQMAFSSSYYLSNNFTALSLANPYQLYDAFLTYRLPSRSFAITAFIKNIGNTPVYTGGQQTNVLTGEYLAAISPPRTYGVRARISF